MPVSAFFDTNILIYALAKDDPRSMQAEELLAGGGVISVQNLSELASVARRKMSMSWNEVRQALDAIRTLCPPPFPITVQTHEAALRVAETYGYGVSDALVIAAALEVGCTILYSEDLQDGQTIDGQVKIRNPFARSSGAPR